MYLDDFMQQHFPNLELYPSLFYKWGIGIRYELGQEKNDSLESYLYDAYKRAKTLFEFLHQPDDTILIVIDVSDKETGKPFERQLKNFAPYVDKHLLFKIQYQQLHSTDLEDDIDPFPVHRFTLRCQTAELQYAPMLKALCNQDFSIQPSLSHFVYFININKKTIFQVYDDRGCDVIARSPDALKEAYTTFNDWILDYDRLKIDNTFRRISV
ncbi:DUF3885 domain-containing protein [Marinilactibacillus sp. Marseille-P9653]|uniref:DUF3885 domain-containing protein n=1 Tax=Marinilactibacillus sp. Marseille-P9653 TaxID=2866583 RepID=UPI001CE3BE78|nr:DUF3885 domain-containing protein [Marinilactibacillus sp. Marseille-P9653]